MEHMSAIDHHHFFIFVNSIGANCTQNTIQFGLVSANGVHLETNLRWFAATGLHYLASMVGHTLTDDKLCSGRPDKPNAIRYECNADYGNLNTLAGFIVFLAHIFIRAGCDATTK